MLLLYDISTVIPLSIIEKCCWDYGFVLGDVSGQQMRNTMCRPRAMLLVGATDYLDVIADGRLSFRPARDYIRALGVLIDATRVVECHSRAELWVENIYSVASGNTLPLAMPSWPPPEFNPACTSGISRPSLPFNRLSVPQ